jgi:predicted Mrr-cat superfamily restriction endonuclease
MTKSAYILRISPSDVDKVPDALESNQIIIGWALTNGLLDRELSWSNFRKLIHKTYYSKDENFRRAGAASGHMWRFIREMKPNDLVVVPYWSKFYVAEVLGDANYDADKVGDDTAYRRSVRWLNDGKPIPRSFAKSALISRMKIYGTSADATDLIDEIEECVHAASQKGKPSFQEDLKKRLVTEVLSEIRCGRMESYGFERLIQSVFVGLGASECKIINRNEDKGADILATFLVAGAFQQRVAVQAKHWQAEPPVSADVVMQLINGIEAEEANLGMVITSGTISESAYNEAARYAADTGIRIELVDGEQFASLIVEHGIKTS